MQKALRNHLFARNQAVKAAHRDSKRAVREERREARQQKIAYERFNLRDIKAERTNRREDWMLGPLAPNRSAGKDGNGYGMLAMQALRRPKVVTAERERYFNFAVKDRVVVIKGRERGKIGEVNDVDEERQTLQLQDINVVGLS
jgi:large subunit ribosomal protein L24